MADETFRHGNERGLYNFVESLCTLLIGTQYSSFEGIGIPALVKGKPVADKFSLFQLKLGCMCRHFVDLGTGNKD